MQKLGRAGRPFLCHANDVVQELLLVDFRATLNELLDVEAEGHIQLRLNGRQPLALAHNGRGYKDAESGVALPGITDEGLNKILDLFQCCFVEIQGNIGNCAVNQFGIHAKT